MPNWPAQFSLVKLSRVIKPVLKLTLEAHSIQYTQKESFIGKNTTHPLLDYGNCLVGLMDSN